MQLKVSYEDQSDGITVVRVEGDGPWAPELRELLARLADDGRLLFVVDLSAVDDVSATGLDVLVGGLKRVHFKGGTLALAVASERVRDILTMTHLTKVLRVHDEVSSAVATLVADYAEESIEQRRAAIAERAARKRQSLAKGVAVSGDYTYEHLSEDITLVSVLDKDALDKGVDAEVSVYTAPALRKVLADLVNQGRYFLVVDLTSIDFLDSTGLGVLVGCLKRVRHHGGSIAVVVSAPRIEKAFRITGLSYVFPKFDTVDSAVEFLGRQVPRAHV